MATNNQTCALDHALRQDLLSAESLNCAFSTAYFRHHDESSSSNTLVAHFFEEKLGPMLAIADVQVLYLLEFYDRKALLNEIIRLRKKTNKNIMPGETPPIIKIKQELADYFAGKLKEFKTPVAQLGTPFQMRAWQALTDIPYGETRSYQEQAHAIGLPKAHRAIANANGCNQLAIIYPCHRIIMSDGGLGGYGGRLPRKKWLLELERGAISEWQGL